MKRNLLLLILFLISKWSIGANDVRIYQIYGGGGNTSATYNEDFVALYNNSNLDFNLNGYSIQYAPSTSSSWNKLDINSLTIKGKGFILISITTTGTVGINLPSPDLIWSMTGSGISETGGKFALMPNQTLISTAAPSGYLDLVGYGSSANAFEGSPVSTTSINSTRSLVRKNDGQDTDDNSADFVNSNNYAPNAIRPLNSSSFPVKLISFLGYSSDNSINLSWSTNFEFNFSHFEIQRSKDAKGFETIGKIDGKGGESDFISYDFMDEKPSFGDNYYRLKQVDFDGAEEFSKIIDVKFSGLAEVLVFPNPTHGLLKLSNFEASEIQLVKVYSSNGKLIKEIREIAENLDLSNVNSGEFILKINLKDHRVIEKRIVKN